MIEFQLLTKAGLEAFIQSEAFSTLKNLPISKLRARSQLRNPRADAADVLLILAYEQQALVGYAGILPDWISVSTGERVKLGWFSCIWVDSTLRGQNIGLGLLQKALELWEGRLLAADYAPETKKLYLKTGSFGDPMVRQGMRIYNRMDLHTILPPKKRIFQQIAPLLRLADTLLNAALGLRRLLPRRKQSVLHTEPIQSIDQETRDFIARFQDASLFERGAAELDWILHHPWVIAGPPDDDSRRYYFSSVDRSFDFHALKLRNAHNQMVAFLLFSKRNRTLKLPFCVMEASMVTDVAIAIESMIVAWRVNTFTTFDDALAAYFTSHKTVGILKKPIERSYMVTHALRPLLETAGRSMQDGDGDPAFT
jgi:GNAT superfamily N-acetyltransferase